MNKNEEVVFDPKFIPMFGGRPDRKSSINEDDILNLLITMNTASTLEDFLALV